MANILEFPIVHVTEIFGSVGAKDTQPIQLSQVFVEILAPETITATTEINWPVWSPRFSGVLESTQGFNHRFMGAGESLKIVTLNKSTIRDVGNISKTIDNINTTFSSDVSLNLRDIQKMRFQISWRIKNEIT